MSKALRAGFQRIDQRRRPVPGRFTRLRWKDGTGPVGPSRSRSDFGRAKHSGSVGTTWTSTPELCSSAAAADDPRWEHGCDGTCGRKFGGYCPDRVALRDETAETKSRAGRRRIGLPDQLVELLRVHRAEQDRERVRAAQLWTDGGWVFASPIGTPLNPRTDWTDWKKLLNRAGVRDGRLHDARHTAATVLLLLGVPERAVMGVMGWSKHGDGSAVPARHRCHPTRHRGPCRRPDLAGRRQSRRHRMRLEVRLDGERRVVLIRRPGVLPGQAGGSGGI